MKHRRTIFHTRVVPVPFPENVCEDTLRRTCVFASGGICVSHNALRCVRGVKHRRTIFHTRVGLVRFPKKCGGTRYAELVFLHPI
jgi:hypothetical protein